MSISSFLCVYMICISSFLLGTLNACSYVYICVWIDVISSREASYISFKSRRNVFVIYYRNIFFVLLCVSCIICMLTLLLYLSMLIFLSSIDMEKFHEYVNDQFIYLYICMCPHINVYLYIIIFRC